VIPPPEFQKEAPCWFVFQLSMSWTVMKRGKLLRLSDERGIGLGSGVVWLTLELSPYLVLSMI